MKAIALTRYLSIDHPESLLDVNLPVPLPGPHDLLVQVQAISVNPVDVKVRAPKEKIEPNPRVLGWDAAGIVSQVGAAVTLFKPGDQVYYAGDLTRPGSNSEFQLVDERIVGAMPTTLSFAEAAALPLTAITAWEALFDRLQMRPHDTPQDIANDQSSNKTLLIIGAAGGVGSLAVQLAAKLTGRTIIATASRPQSQAWVRALGAHHVIDHSQPLVPQINALGFQYVDDILILNHIDQHFQAAAEAIAPQGKICTIIEHQRPLAIELLKMKSVAFLQEFMFTRSMYQTADMIEQHHLLNRIARLIDHGTIKTTLNKVLSPINAHNLKAAHAEIETGQVIGKIVLTDF